MALKRTYPAVFLALAGVILAGDVYLGLFELDSRFALMPLALPAIGYAMFYVLFGNIADEVEDDGDNLVVRRGAIEQRLALADVVEVSMNYFGRPPRVLLRLREPGRLGGTIEFIPKGLSTFGPFVRTEVFEGLARRVERQRDAGARSR